MNDADYEELKKYFSTKEIANKGIIEHADMTSLYHNILVENGVSEVVAMNLTAVFMQTILNKR